MFNLELPSYVNKARLDRHYALRRVNFGYDLILDSTFVAHKVICVRQLHTPLLMEEFLSTYSIVSIRF